MPVKNEFDKALALLRQNPAQNAYGILRLRQGAVDECWVYGNGVLLHDGHHNKYCYAVTSPEELEALYTQVAGREGEMVSLVSDADFLPLAQKLGKNLRGNACTQLRATPYTGNAPKVEGVRFGPVTAEVADWIPTVYQHPEMTPGFVLERVEKAPGIAAFKNGAPVGFFVTHSGAELGPVYVDPAMRGSGLAEALYAKMMERVPVGEDAPVLFVMLDNHASRKWLLRMGCVPAPKPVGWFWRDMG